MDYKISKSRKFESSSSNSSTVKSKAPKTRTPKSTTLITTLTNQYTQVSWSYIQSSVEERWNVMSDLRQILWQKPRDASLSDLREIFQVRGDLGKGVYGKVYDVVLTPELRPQLPYHFALKIVSVADSKSERQDLIMKVMRENQAFGYTNALVFLKICPNFTLVPRAFFTRNKERRRASYFCCLIIMERENGSMKAWLELGQHTMNTKLMMSAILQVLMAIAACSKHIKLCHNDLYFNNILYCDIEPTNMVYQMSGHQYYLHHCIYLFKMADFGIASSPDFLDNRHTDMGHLISDPKIAESMRTFKFKYHILEYKNVQPYARDLAVFLRSLSLVPQMDGHVQTWINESLKTLDRYCEENRMHSHTGPSKFIEEILSPSFLRRSKLSGSIFSIPENHDYKNTEIYNIDGPQNTPESLVWLVSDHLYGYTSTPKADKKSKRR